MGNNNKGRRKARSADAIKDYFDKSGLTFEDFEDAPSRSGNIRRDGIAFTMRVGLHLGAPSQAIMARGQFLKVRRAPKFANQNGGGYVLHPLNPNQPDRCRHNGSWIPQRKYLSWYDDAIWQNHMQGVAASLKRNNALLNSIVKK